MKSHLMGFSQSIGEQPIRRVSISHGDDGTIQTLKIMKDIINESAKNYYVRRWAEVMVAGAKDDILKVKKIHQYLKSHADYLRDISGTELIKTPLVSLQLLELGERPQLDCDDWVILSLSLYKSIGFRVAMRVGSYNRPTFQHVYDLVNVKGQWIPIDFSTDHEIGWEGKGAKRIYDMEVTD